MNPWRRLVQWLARRDIAELTRVCTAACAAHVEATDRASAFIEQQAERSARVVEQMDVVKAMAFAEGQVCGRKEMYDHIDRVVAARTLGTGDYVSLEDLAAAKKGLVH